MSGHCDGSTLRCREGTDDRQCLRRQRASPRSRRRARDVIGPIASKKRIRPAARNAGSFATDAAFATRSLRRAVVRLRERGDIDRAARGYRSTASVRQRITDASIRKRRRSGEPVGTDPGTGRSTRQSARRLFRATGDRRKDSPGNRGGETGAQTADVGRRQSDGNRWCDPCDRNIPLKCGRDGRIRTGDPLTPSQ